MLALNNNYTISSRRMHIPCYSRRGDWSMLFLKVNEILNWWILSSIWPGRCFDKASSNEEWPVLYTFKDATHTYTLQYIASMSVPLRRVIARWKVGAPLKVISANVPKGKENPTHIYVCVCVSRATHSHSHKGASKSRVHQKRSWYIVQKYQISLQIPAIGLR